MFAVTTPVQFGPLYKLVERGEGKKQTKNNYAVVSSRYLKRFQAGGLTTGKTAAFRGSSLADEKKRLFHTLNLHVAQLSHTLAA